MAAEARDEVEEDPKAGKKAKEEKILTLARKRFAVAVEAEQENRQKQLSDLQFLAASPDDNWQWPDDVLSTRQNKAQEGGARPCLTINKLPQHHRQVTNEQKMNRPQIKFRPANEKAAVETAKVCDGIMRHIQQASEADLAYDLACDAQVAMGEGFFRILTDYCDERSFDQDIVIAPLADRFKVYLDPIGLLQHPAGRKCQWGFITEELPKEEYEEQFGDENPVDWNEAGIGDMADWLPNKETVRIAEYLAIESEKKKLFKFANGMTMIEGEDLPAGLTVAEKPVDERTTRVPRCIWRKITGQAILSERKMPTKYVPIVRVVGNQWIIDGKPVTSGIVRNAKDAQRMYNYNASMEVELNALAPKAPFIGYAEQFEGHEDQWRKANTVPFGFLTANMIYDEATGSPVVVPLPQRAQPAMPQAAVITAKMSAADDIKSTTGQYDPSLGNNPQAKSGIALQREQVKSEVGTFHYIDNHRRALDYAGAICLDMLPRVYSGKRVARILGEDGEADRVTLDSSQGAAYQKVQGADGKEEEVYNLAIGKYDLVVTTGPSFTTKRQEASEFLTNAIQAAKDPVMAQVLTYLALKSNDWAGATEATEMVKKLLPPGLVDDEDGQDPVIQTPQGPIPSSKVGELITQLTQQLQQAAEQLKASGDGQQALAEAKRIMAEAKAQGAAMQARDQIMQKTLEAEQAKDETVRTKIVSDLKLLVERALAGLERMKIAQVQAKEGEDAGVAQQRAAEADAKNQAISAQQAELVTALSQAISLLAAPRQITLQTDESGQPTGATSQPVMA